MKDNTKETPHTPTLSYDHNDIEIKSIQREGRLLLLILTGSIAFSYLLGTLVGLLRLAG